MNRRVAAAMALMTTGFVTVAVCGDQSSESSKGDKARATKEVDSWMKGKLRFAQRIFDGLTNGDLDAVESSARRMQGMHVLEKWLRSNEYVNQSDYKGQLNAFEYAVKELVRHSQDADIDGSLEAYVAMSRSCVQCHKLVRDRPEEP